MEEDGITSVVLLEPLQVILRFRFFLCFHSPRCDHIIHVCIHTYILSMCLPVTNIYASIHTYIYIYIQLLTCAWFIVSEIILATATPVGDELEQYKMKWSLSTGETLTIQMPIENSQWERNLGFSVKGSSLGMVRICWIMGHTMVGTISFLNLQLK